MNTWIWGPPKWKFLHTLSFSRTAPQYSVAVADFLNTLKFVLPCIYCRESYTGFVQQLEAQFSLSLPQVIARNQLSRFMYALHDKVNEKLDVQETHDRMKAKGMDVAALSAEQDKAVCRKRQITYDCLVKRFKLRAVQYCAEDVWEFLFIFGLNMDDTLQRASAEQQTNWIQFFQLIPLMVRIASEDSKAEARLVRYLFALAPHVERAITLKDASIFSTLVYHKCLFDKQQYTQAVVDQQLQLYTNARASTCTHGSCK